MCVCVTSLRERKRERETERDRDRERERDWYMTVKVAVGQQGRGTVTVPLVALQGPQMEALINPICLAPQTLLLRLWPLDNLYTPSSTASASVIEARTNRDLRRY